MNLVFLCSIGLGWQKSMAQSLQFPPPYYLSSSISRFNRHLKILGRHHRIPIIKSFWIRSALATSTGACSQRSPEFKFASHTALPPYLQSEWRPILSGWICCGVSVYSLSKLVPLSGARGNSLLRSPFRIWRAWETGFCCWGFFFWSELWRTICNRRICGRPHWTVHIR